MTGDDPLRGGLGVINLGLERFAEDLRRAGVPVVHVDWRPPGDGDPSLALLLMLLDDHDESPAAPPRGAAGSPSGDAGGSAGQERSSR